MDFFHPRWPVFYLDNHLLVVYKPAGLIMQRDKPGKANLSDLAKIWLKHRFDKPGRVFAAVVHRLDAPVAGVIVLARTSKAAARLSEQFRRHGVEKIYLAAVHGQPPHSEGRLVHHVERAGRQGHIVHEPTAVSREARLAYRLRSMHGDTALLRIDLETGRHHQIRLQLAASGCPIIGDKQYGADKGLADGRIALVASALSFDHPTRKHRMRFETGLPEGWPIPTPSPKARVPLWSLEDFEKAGLALPRLADYP